MPTIRPPESLRTIGDRFAVFLAGSIELGTATDWQRQVEAAFAGDERICLLNPRRDVWDPSWRQSIDEPRFREQVDWELDGLQRADLVVFHFVPGTQSPITLLELGLCARGGKALVCCPAGFWRKGNVDIVCARMGIAQVDDLAALVAAVRARIPG